MMNKRVVANVCRIFVVGITLAALARTVSAQSFSNGGFEAGGGLYTNTANTSQITTAALSWVQFNHAFRVKASDLVPNPDNPAANQSATFPGAHGGSYVFQCYGPFGNWDASGAYQVVTNGVTSGQTWILNGFALNWSGDPMTNTTLLAQQFGQIQLVCQGASSNTIATFTSPESKLNPTSNVPVDTWISCSVTGTTPVGTTRILIYAMHVAFNSGNTGSIFWDDLSLVNTGASSQTNRFFQTIDGGNQVCWLSTAGRSYQPQYTNSVTGPVWTNLGGEVAGDGNTNCVFDASKQKFYRILELQ